MGEKEKNFKNTELSEDGTQYGEFISSFFAWQTPKEQKRRVEELENLTKNNNNQQGTNKKINNN